MSIFTKPSKAHLEWADCEIGVLIHYDMQVYEPGYNFEKDMSYQPSASKFNPSSLNTDQWLETASSLGAKYAVLVAKHCTGFSFWPTKAHDYSVASSPWKNGKGDVVADFIKSCEKFGIRPGIYASCGANARFQVRDAVKDSLDPEKWGKYLPVVLTQLRELWTNYGKLFEIWFDGGNLPEDKGGKEVSDLLCELQPDAVAFQGDPKRISSVRWIGNERAEASYPCFSRVNNISESDGMQESEFDPLYTGVFDGEYWCPGEADTPNRDQIHASHGGWLWQPGEDKFVHTPAALLEKYYSSVGRNCNLLLGMVIDDRGLVPDADCKQFSETGKLIREQYSCCRGKQSGDAFILDIEIPDGAPVNMVCLMEDIQYGEMIRVFTVSGLIGEGEDYYTLVTGKIIGHKFLLRIPEVHYKKYRLRVHSCKGGGIPRIREFSLWHVQK